MEIYNVIKEIKSRSLSTSQTFIVEFARWGYQMNEEDVIEALDKKGHHHKMVKDGKLILLKDKNIHFHRFVESAPVINLKEERKETEIFEDFRKLSIFSRKTLIVSRNDNSSHEAYRKFS